jgi:hypothetical protein
LEGTDPTRLSAKALISYAIDLPARDNLLQAMVRAYPNGQNTMCVTAGNVTQSVKVTRAAIEATAAAFGMPSGATNVVPTIDVVVAGRTIRMTIDTAGPRWFNLLRTLGAQSRPQTLDMRPPLEEIPVRLTLTTVDQQRITLPAELNGADKKYKIAANAVWQFSNGDTLPVDQGNFLQQMLIAQMVNDGTARIERITPGSQHPSWKAIIARPQPRIFDIHVTGTYNKWFAKSQFQPGAIVIIQREVEGCDLNIRVEPSVLTIPLPELPITAWKSVTGLTLVDTSAYEVAYGFLDGPAAATHIGNLDGAAFDAMMQRPKTCEQFCYRVTAKVKANYQSAYSQWAAQQSSGMFNSTPAPRRIEFDTRRCERNCAASSAYLKCVNSATSDRSIVECQERAPLP